MANCLVKHIGAQVRLIFTLVLAISVLPVMGMAQSGCIPGEPQTHVTERGETLQSIAKTYYGDEKIFVLLLNANKEVLSGARIDRLRSGIALLVPCLDMAKSEDPPVQVPEEIPETRKINDVSLAIASDVELKILTGGAYPPFTDQDLTAGGLVTDIVDNAFSETTYPVTYDIFWEDDWAIHFDLIKSGDFEMGFPWLKPDCQANPDVPRCDFHFSEPIFEVVVKLYSHVSAPIGFRTDADIAGHSVCRPEGYFTHDLDRPDRRWIAEGTITYVTAASPTDCFERLARGEVDSVSLNEFTALEVISTLGLKNCILDEPHPVSIEGLHAITYRRAWRATAHRQRFNEGVKLLKEKAEYAVIVDQHMENFITKLELGSGVDDRCDAYQRTPGSPPKRR